MKAQFEVDAVLWRKIRLDAIESGKTMGELIEPVLVKHWGSVRPVVNPAPQSSPMPLPVSTKVSVEEPLMKKCGRCFESFSVASMTRDPKTGKYYCAGCVDNMRNGQ